MSSRSFLIPLLLHRCRNVHCASCRLHMPRLLVRAPHLTRITVCDIFICTHDTSSAHDLVLMNAVLPCPGH